MDLRARRRARLLRDRRLHRADRTRRDGAAARRPRGRPGPGRRPDHDRRRVGVRSRRRPHELLPRPSPRPCLHGQARLEGADHRGAPGAGRALLRSPRRQGDPHRALRRPRARGGAVHGRIVGHAAAPLRALRRHRRRALGLDLRRARLRLLAELQPARRLREEGRAGSGRGHRARGRDRVARPLGARPRQPRAHARVDGAPGAAAGAAPAGRACWRRCCARRGGRPASCGTA